VHIASGLKVFGSLIYIHVPKEKRTRLEPSNLKGVLIGYNESSKDYNIYVPS
jgi:hypothetical protein